MILGIFILTLIITFLSKSVVSKKPASIGLLLSFSGAFLLGITILHILPELYVETDNDLVIGIVIMCGFFIQIILESYSRGIEHGHIHIHEGVSPPTSLFIALCVHAFLEGAALQPPHSIELISAIMIHKAPVAFLLGMLVFSSFKNKLSGKALIILFASSTPLGAYLGGFLNHHVFFGVEASSLLLALATGSFLHVSTTILFETSPDHKLKINKFLPAIFGGILAILSTQIHIH